MLDVRLRMSVPAILALLTVPVLAAPAAAEVSPQVLAEFRDDPIRFYFDQRPADAIECAQVVLSDTTLTPSARHEVLTTVGTIYLARKRPADARAAFLGVLADDPTLDLPYAEAMPRAVVSYFYGLRDSLLLESERPLAPDIATLAVGDIENNSVFVSDEYDMDRFAEGLRHVLTTDLLGATPLKLVDRQRLDVLQAEIGMSRSADIVDPRYRTQIGKLSGAQSYLFGSFILLEKDLARIDLRWVNTSTGEILLSEGVEGKFRSSKDLIELERRALMEHLLPQVRVMIGEAADGDEMHEKARELIEQRKKALPDRDAYMNLVLKTGEAVLAEERGDLVAAQAAWSEVSQLDPANAYADLRAQSLRAFDSES